MSAVPHARQARRARGRRRWHGAALVAALAYAAAGFALYQLVGPMLGGRSGSAAEPEAAAAAAGAPDLSPLGTRDALALRAIGSRVQRSAYVVQVAGAGKGSGFVAWVHAQKVSFVLTARPVVAGVLADRERTVYVKQGKRFWPARVVLASKPTGVALLRVDAPLDRPLWQQPSDRSRLIPGGTALVVPAGRSTVAREGRLSSGPDGLALAVDGRARDLGAAVVDQDGRLGGVVVGVRPDGGLAVFPLGRACGTIRSC